MVDNLKRIFFVAIWVGLVIGSLDFLLNVADSSLYSAIPARFVVAPTLTAIGLGLVAVLAISLTLSLPMFSKWGLDIRSAAPAAGLMVIAVCLYPIVLGPESILKKDVFRFYLMAVIGSSILFYFILKTLPLGSRARRIGGVVLESGPIAAASAALIPAVLYAASGYASPSSVLVWGVALVVLVLWSVRGIRRSDGPDRGWQNLLVAVLIMLATMAASSVGRGTRGTRFGDDDSMPPVSPIILITVDTMRADRLNCEKSAGHDTKIPDALCANSTWFRSAYSTSSWTLPSVTSILTGTAPWVHGATTKSAIALNELTTLAEFLSANGYRTYAIVRNMFLGPEKNLSQGFDQYWHFRRNPGSIGQAALDVAIPDLVLPDGSTEDFTDLAQKLLARTVDDPVFLWVHFLDPHIPYEPPARYLDSLNSSEKELGTSFSRHVALRGGYYAPGAAERSWIEDLYDLETEYVRDEIERLIQWLHERDLYDSSLIVLTSDHGEEFWEHGRFEHGHSLFEEVIKVPIVIKAPFSSHSQASDVAVAIDSVFATIVDLAGLGESPKMMGPSLAPLIRNPKSAEEVERPLFALSNLYYEEQVGVIFDDYKYVSFPVTGNEIAFDIESDPEESLPIHDPSHEVYRLGRGLLEAMLLETSNSRAALKLEATDTEHTLSEDVKQGLRALGYVE